MNQTSTWAPTVCPEDRPKVIRMFESECHVRTRSKVRSFAARINDWIHNEPISEEEARTRLTDLMLQLNVKATLRAEQEPGWEANAGWWRKGLRNGTHMERWFQSQGFQATYLRVGKTYLKDVAAWKDQHPHRIVSDTVRDQLWDAVVDAYVARQSDSRKGRWANWSDGRSSNPQRATDKSNKPDPQRNGRVMYETMLEDLRTRLRMEHETARSIEEDPTLRSGLDTADGWLDATWLVDHNVTLDRIQGLDETSLRSLGINPESFMAAKQVLAEHEEQEARLALHAA